jgi:hypothetical protein
MSNLKFSLLACAFMFMIAFVAPKEIGYRKLNWRDFKGKPDSRGVALSYTQINFEANFSDGKYYFVVYSQFLPYKSFTTTAKEKILRHEQLHFDITELMVRKMRRLLVGVNDQKESNNIYTQVIKEWGEMQRQYDWETNNSINQEQQAKWEIKISNSLNNYN